MIRKCRYNYDKVTTACFVNAKFKNAKLYWNMLKEASGMKKGNIAMSTLEQFNKAANNPADQFYTPDEDIMYFNERYENDEFDIMFNEMNLNFLQEEILETIMQIKTNKSAGPDKLINELFIHGREYLLSTLHTPFNKRFELDYFPETWSEGFIIPLHKR